VLLEIKEIYKVDVDYPLAQFVMALGFFIILLLEQTVLHFKVSRDQLLYRINILHCFLNQLSVLQLLIFVL
jgi:hypothetical protein